MKAIIIYKSQTGFTEKYARWIAEETGLPLISIDEMKNFAPEDYDAVIFGSYIHASKINGLKKIKDLTAGKTKLLLFATGASPADSKEDVDGMWKENLTDAELAAIPHFYMPAGLNYERMKGPEKLLMKTMAKVVGKASKKSDPADTDNYGAEMAAAIQGSYDISSREFIRPLVECLKTMGL